MPKGPLNGYTVLFADDEPQYIEALFAMAEADGATVRTCRNASAAIKIVNAEKIDCLVIDVMMAAGKDLPNVDPQRAGIEAISIIRKLNPRQPIICLSVLANEAQIEKLKSNGVLFLRKGETSLDKAWRLISSKMNGVYST